MYLDTRGYRTDLRHSSNEQKPMFYESMLLALLGVSLPAVKVIIPSPYLANKVVTTVRKQQLLV
jgi:hypothetical protein